MQCTTKEISFPVEGQGEKNVYTIMKRTFLTEVFILIGFSSSNNTESVFWQ